MKITIQRSTFILLAAAGLLAMYSCSEKEIIAEPDSELAIYTEQSLDKVALVDEFFVEGNSNLKCANIDICGEVKVYPLIASKKYYAGALLVFNDANNLYVTFYSWLSLSNFHLYVGDKNGMPINKGKNPVPGQFPYKDEAAGKYSKTFQIPLSSIPECYTLAAHTVYGCHTIWAYSGVTFTSTYGSSTWGWVAEDCLETCPEVNVLTLKSLLRDTITNEANWGYITVPATTIIPDKYCQSISLVEPGNGTKYNLLQTYTANNYIGEIETSYLANTLRVSITSTLPNTVVETTHLFYGTNEEYQQYIEPGGCPKYFNWPYLSTQFATTQIIEIPLD